MSTPAFSVVIGTVNRPELAAASVRSVLDGSWVDLEVLVIDQSSDDRTREAITRIGDPRVVYIHSAEMGLSRARNVGAARARGPLLAFLDDDAVAAPGWLAAYADAFASAGSRAGLIGGKLLPRWEAPCPRWFPAAHAHVLGLYDLGDARREFPRRAFPMGGNFAIPADVLRNLHGFDLRLGFDQSRASRPIAGEDTALAEAARAAGLLLVYEPRAAVLHLVPAGKLRRRYYLRRMYWAGRSLARLRQLRPAASEPDDHGSDLPARNRTLENRGVAPLYMGALGSVAVLLGLLTGHCARVLPGPRPRERA